MGRTMFGPPRSVQLSRVVNITSVPAARESVRILNREFNAASRPKMLHVARATNLAGARALQLARRRGVTTKERAELRRVSDIYGTAASNMFRRYRSK